MTRYAALKINHSCVSNDIASLRRCTDIIDCSEKDRLRQSLTIDGFQIVHIKDSLSPVYRFDFCREYSIKVLQRRTLFFATTI
jgi:hypothetical protein